MVFYKKVIIDGKLPFDAKDLTLLVGLDGKFLDAKRLTNKLRPKMVDVFILVNNAFKTLLNQSSTAFGDYQKGPGWRGARDTDTLYQSLRYDFEVTKAAPRQYEAFFSIYSNAPHFDYAEAERNNVPPPGVLVNWARRNLDGWGAVPAVSDDASFADLKGELRGVKIAYGEGDGMSALFLLGRMMQSIAERQPSYTGINLTARIQDFYRKALAKVIAGGGILSESELRDILGF